jgi:DNA-binding NtrC family response regulator
MIVDDDPAVRRLLSKILIDAHYTVIEAENGRQALAHLSQDQRADLVISDLVMPEQEGLETIQTIHQRYPSLKMIAISGAFDGAFLKVAVQLGASTALPKPISPSGLLAAVEHVLMRDPG